MADDRFLPENSLILQGLWGILTDTIIIIDMIRIYRMETCPDCTYVEEQVKGDGRYEIVDIGAHVRNLKAFLKLRDNDRAFDGAKIAGAVGIPCFVLEDGRVTLVPEEAGLRSRPAGDGASCNMDGSGC